VLGILHPSHQSYSWTAENYDNNHEFVTVSETTKKAEKKKQKGEKRSGEKENSKVERIDL
jgi:predicted N-acyltransferase